MSVRKPGSVVVYVAENWNSLITFGGSHTYQILTTSVKLFMRYKAESVYSLI
jgi:alpha-glucuronidase